MSDLTIHTSVLFDPKQKAFIDHISITVNKETGVITKVTKRDEASEKQLVNLGEDEIDLRGKIVLPGLVDAHSHIFLHSYDESDNLKQKRDESMAERIIRAVNHCRLALMAGYTTYRDLGSEGLQEADANVRDAIARGLTPGPRLFVATRVLASTGGFELRTENSMGGHCLPAGPDVIDGVEEARKAVRRRIAAGADVIKIFADYRRRIMRFPPAQPHPYISSMLHPPPDPNPNVPLFAQEEIDMVVGEAKLARCPVAAHCLSLEGALSCARAGVNTIEHLSLAANDELFSIMKANGVILVPTLTVLERLRRAEYPLIRELVKKAHDSGVRLACGGDTGTFPHGENARELELMVDAGISVEDVLESCTIGGWEACGGDLCGYRFGWFEEGLRADIIALDTDPREDPDALKKVNFVMKDAKVWKRDGKFVGFS